MKKNFLTLLATFIMFNYKQGSIRYNQISEKEYDESDFKKKITDDTISLSVNLDTYPHYIDGKSKTAIFAHKGYGAICFYNNGQSYCFKEKNIKAINNQQLSLTNDKIVNNNDINTQGYFIDSMGQRIDIIDKAIDILQYNDILNNKTNTCAILLGLHGNENQFFSLHNLDSKILEKIIEGGMQLNKRNLIITNLACYSAHKCAYDNVSLFDIILKQKQLTGYKGNIFVVINKDPSKLSSTTNTRDLSNTITSGDFVKDMWLNLNDYNTTTTVFVLDKDNNFRSLSQKELNCILSDKNIDLKSERSSKILKKRKTLNHLYNSDTKNAHNNHLNTKKDTQLCFS